MTRLAPWWAGAAAVLLLSSCATDAEQEPTAEGGHENEFGHVHDLAVNPADDRLYVASHMGVFRQTDEGFERIADRWQDTMAFTVAGPDHFLGSGHPDTREDKPAHLGLIESTDGAETWEALSLEGEADFHVLELAGERLYGYDSQTGTLRMTQDRRSWTDVIAAPLIDAEADPDDPDALLLTDQRGVLMRLEVGGRPASVEGAPQMGWLDWPAADLVVGLGPAGEVWVSRDAGTAWEQAGSVSGGPQALSVAADRWYVATDRGLFVSADDGKTWDTVELG
ncbi:MAG TPA: hypothetical protein VFZ64_09785 [Nocardioidaceae bacterium]